MANELANDQQTSGKTELSHRFDSGSTLTDERTNGLTHDLQDSGENTHVPNTSTPVDNRDSSRWVIRKRIFPWTGRPAWRITHPSLPAYFHHSFHMDSWEDAIEYVNDHLRASEATS